MYTRGEPIAQDRDPGRHLNPRTARIAGTKSLPVRRRRRRGNRRDPGSRNRPRRRPGTMETQWPNTALLVFADDPAEAPRVVANLTDWGRQLPGVRRPAAHSGPSRRCRACPAEEPSTPTRTPMTVTDHTSRTEAGAWVRLTAASRHVVTSDGPPQPAGRGRPDEVAANRRAWARRTRANAPRPNMPGTAGPVCFRGAAGERDITCGVGQGWRGSLRACSP